MRDWHPLESPAKSLPFLLGQHPFAQGITSSAAMADVLADAIESAEVADLMNSAVSVTGTPSNTTAQAIIRLESARLVATVTSLARGLSSER
jgi:hypothetical protein